MKKIIALFLFTTLVLGSCNREEQPTPFEYYASSREVATYTANELKDYFTAGGVPELAATLQYDITIYIVEYKTLYKGEEITASGLLSVPNTEDKVPISSFQHGTIAMHNETSTVNWTSYFQIAWLASSGYMLLIPDFIGFGSSKEVLHPYYEAETTGRSIIDMVKAATEFARSEHVAFDGRLFLAGYSEGGFATMAAHKYIEENPVSGIELIASAPASGGYDVKNMQEYFFSLDEYAQPFYIAYVAMAYTDYYDWSDPMSLYFNDPYASRIPDLFDGNHSYSDINNQLTNSIAELINPDMLAGSDTNPAYSHIKSAFEENSLTNWVPEAKMYMYHGTDDITVPYHNSEITYDKLMQNGTSPGTIEFIPLEGKTHSTSFYPYLLDVVEKFELLR